MLPLSLAVALKGTDAGAVYMAFVIGKSKFTAGAVLAGSAAYTLAMAELVVATPPALSKTLAEMV